MRAIPQKIQILKFIAEQGIVGIEDINRYLFSEDKFKIIRSSLYDLKLAHLRYCNYYGGLWYIDDQKHFDLLSIYYPRLPQFKVIPPSAGLIAHYLELNNIRIALQKSTKISIEQWWSESYLRALTPSMRLIVCDSKIPDAIFWRRCKDGSQQKFFLEYERSLKSKERYEDILFNYAKRDDVQDKNVVYICEDESIKNELESIEEHLVKRGKIDEVNLFFQFITLDDFYKAYNNTNLKLKGENCHEQDKEIYANTTV